QGTARIPGATEACQLSARWATVEPAHPLRLSTPRDSTDPTHGDAAAPRGAATATARGRTGWRRCGTVGPWTVPHAADDAGRGPRRCAGSHAARSRRDWR